MNQLFALAKAAKSDRQRLLYLKRIVCDYDGVPVPEDEAVIEGRTHADYARFEIAEIRCRTAALPRTAPSLAKLAREIVSAIADRDVKRLRAFAPCPMRHGNHDISHPDETIPLLISMKIRPDRTILKEEEYGEGVACLFDLATTGQVEALHFTGVDSENSPIPPEKQTSIKTHWVWLGTDVNLECSGGKQLSLH